MSIQRKPGGLALLHKLATCLVPLIVAGCATAADPSLMTVTSAGARGFPAAFQHALCVRTISGGEETNPLWVSQVGNTEFGEALKTSLGDAQLLAPPNSCKYTVDVDLLGLSQPAAGISMEVTSHANYKVYSASGKPVLLETISAAYTAEFTESVVGAIRLKHANEGAIRASISQFLDKLRTAKG